MQKVKTHLRTVDKTWRSRRPAKPRLSWGQMRRTAMDTKLLNLQAASATSKVEQEMLISKKVTLMGEWG